MRQTVVLEEDMSHSINERDSRWDIIKGIAIFLVILGHCIQVMDPEWRVNSVYGFIYSFHMPLFMFISGFFTKLVGRPTSWRWFIRRTERLFVPCCVHGTLLALAHVVLIREFHGLPNLLSLLNAVWYLLILYILSVVMLVIEWIPTSWGKCIAWCVFAVSIFIAAFAPDSQYILFMLPFFLVGNLMRRYQLLYPSTWLLSLLSVVFFFVFPLWNFESSVYTINFATGVQSVVKDFMFLYVCGFCGIGFVLFVCKYFPVKENGLKAISYIGRRTLDLYVLQIYLMRIFEKIHLFSTANIFFHVLLALIEIILCLSLAWLLRRNRLLSRLLFGVR